MASVTRRRVLRAVAGTAAVLSAGRAARAAERPNIVFIMADDLGYADIGCYGRPDLATPHVDRIAAQGVRFTQGYANSPVCSATRTALITGRYQYRLPVGLEEPVTTRFTGGIPADHPTLPGLLRRAGYRTALVGKWHLGAVQDYGPLQRGYDTFWGFRGGTIDYFSHRGTDDRPDLWDGDVPVEQSGYVTHLLGQRAVETVAALARGGRPFFLSLHFNAPHWPWETPDDAAESRRIAGSNLRHFDGGTQETYRRIVAEMDTQIGRVLDALEAAGVAQDTIVVFTSDNGGERFSDTWPFTGRKTELLEGGLRVPALLSWPRRLPAGTVSAQTTITMDWLPTLLAAAGVAPDPAYPSDGVDLLPILTGQAPEHPRRLHWRYRANGQAALRDGTLKYLKIRDNTFLFDVAADPLERANLKSRRPEDFARLQAAWQAWNETMLPERPDSFSETYNGGQLADHFGQPPRTLPPPASAGGGAALRAPERAPFGRQDLPRLLNPRMPPDAASALCHLPPLLDPDAVVVDAGGRAWSSADIRETAAIMALFTMLPAALLALMKLAGADPAPGAGRERLDGLPSA